MKELDLVIRDIVPDYFAKSLGQPRLEILRNDIRKAVADALNHGRRKHRLEGAKKAKGYVIAVLDTAGVEIKSDLAKGLAQIFRSIDPAALVALMEEE